MDTITKKDVLIFAKVLREIAIALEKEPELMNIFLGKNLKKEKVIANPDILEKIREIDLFGYAKEHGIPQLGNYLKDFSTEELKALMKRYSFGHTKLKTVESISALIMDQVEKRTTDVFLTHEK